MTFAYDSPIPYDELQSYDFVGSFGSGGVLPAILPHLDARLTLQGDGTFNFWQQGTIDEVAQCVEMVCGTIAGQRTVVPNFGIPDVAFTVQSQKQAIEKAINTWEDRAAVTVSIKTQDNGTQSVQVNTAIKRGGVVKSV